MHRYRRRRPRPKLPMGMYVCAEQCAECLFTRNRVVNAERAAEIIKGCLAADRFFVCHKHSLREQRGEAARTDAHVCCRAFFDRYSRDVWPLRYALMTDGIVFVNEQGEAVAGEGWGPQAAEDEHGRS